MLEISEGVVRRPQKVAIYGPEGIGKSTIASKFPDPLFIDTEGGTSHMAVRRIKTPADWERLISTVREVAFSPDICRTLVIDTADWAEQMAVSYILKKYSQPSIESFGYGKGYTYLGEEFARLLAALDQVIAAGMNVCVTAHAKMRKFEQPDEMGAYDRWEMKLSRQAAPLLKEWADLLLFCNYETYVVKDENNVAKGQGGRRVMYTSHHPCWDAKNRCGLPDKVDLDFASIASIFEDVPAEPGLSPLGQVKALMEKDGVTEEQVRRAVASKGHYAEDIPLEQYEEKFLTGWLIKYWNKVLEIIKAQG